MIARLSYRNAKEGSNLKYSLLEESGPDHAKLFKVEVLVDGKAMGTGSGPTKKAAEQEAAYQALLKFSDMA